MNFLDCDSSTGTLSHNGRSALRDIVQFVPFRKFEGRSYTAVAEETLRQQASARHFEMPEVELVPPDAPDQLPIAEVTLQD